MRNIYILLVTILIVLGVSSCKDQDEVYKEFVVEGGYKYPQKLDSLKVYPGYNKLKISWNKLKDPSVERGKIFWNSYQDSIEINSATLQKSEVIIPDLKEGQYTFSIITFDEDGNRSMVSEVSGSTYGEIYLSSLIERTVKKSSRDVNNLGNISWESPSSDLVYTEIRYKQTDGKDTILRISADEDELVCPHVKSKEKFEYRSYFLPKNGIDTVHLNWRSSTSMFVYFYLRDQWTAKSRSGNHDWGDKIGKPECLLDNNPGTGWHSKPGSPFPQILTVDMSEPIEIDALKLILPSQESWCYLSDIQIYIGDNEFLMENPESWGEPDFTTTYKLSKPYNQEYNITLPATKKGRYLTLVFPNSKPDHPYISFKELYACLR